MADIFLQQDAQELLTGKTIYFIGDSNMRAVYKDLVQLSGRNSLMTPAALKSRMEKNFNGDELVFHGPKSNGRNYREERLYKDAGFVAKFFFITRCYNDYVESIFNQMDSLPPDVVVYNSCLWDVSRWGPQGVDKYKENVELLLKRLKEVLLPSCLFIWTTTLPPSQNIYGGFLIPQVEFLKHTLRFDVIEANLFTRKKVSESGYDVLDLHYHVRWQIHRRAKDGVHWLPHVVRHITNLLLTHVCLAWNRPLPRHSDSILLTGVINMHNKTGKTNSCSEPEVASDENFDRNAWKGSFNQGQDYRINRDSRCGKEQFSYQSQPIAQLQAQYSNCNNPPSSCFPGPPLPSNAFRFEGAGNENFRRGFQNEWVPPQFDGYRRHFSLMPNFQNNERGFQNEWVPPLFNGCSGHFSPKPDFRNNCDTDYRRVIVRQPPNFCNEFPNPFNATPDPCSNYKKSIKWTNKRKRFIKARRGNFNPDKC